MNTLKTCILFLLLSHSLLFAKPDAPRVTVVGAGLAGLTLAYELEKRLGIELTVIEARKRPGGRVFTAHIGNSYEELGGKCLNDGGEAVHIRSLIAELGLQTQRSALVSGKLQTSIDRNLQSLNSVFRDGPAADDDNLNRLKDLARTSQSLAEVLEPVFPSNTTLRQLLDRRNENYEGRKSSELSPFYLSSFWNFYESQYARAISHQDEAYYSCDHVKGGNSRLVNALAKSLKQKIHYGMPLQRIEQASDSDALVLRFADQSSIETDILVLAIPGSKYRDLEFEGDLISEERLEALHSIQMGTNAKILVPIRIADNERLMPTTLRSFPWFNHDRSILTVYYGAERGIFASEDLEDLFSKERKDLLESCPSIEFPKGTQIVSMTESNVYASAVGISWVNEEYSKGSYSSWGVGHDSLFNDFIMEDGITVRKPFRPLAGKIYFAGEHVAVNNPSTMEGAVESGRILADQLESILKLKVR